MGEVSKIGGGKGQTTLKYGLCHWGWGRGFFTAQFITNYVTTWKSMRRDEMPVTSALRVSFTCSIESSTDAIDDTILVNTSIACDDIHEKIARAKI